MQRYEVGFCIIIRVSSQISQTIPGQPLKSLKAFPRSYSQCLNYTYSIPYIIQKVLFRIFHKARCSQFNVLLQYISYRWGGGICHRHSAAPSTGWNLSPVCVSAPQGGTWSFEAVGCGFIFGILHPLPPQTPCCSANARFSPELFTLL